MPTVFAIIIGLIAEPARAAGAVPHEPVIVDACIGRSGPQLAAGA